MAISPGDVAHLLRRTGFGGTAAQITALSSQELPAVVDSLLSLSGAPADNPPSTLRNTNYEQWQQFISWKLWWYHRMVTTPTPLQEKMTLFWHGHFTTEFEKLYRADLMYEQNKLFRTNCLGNFRTLAQAVALQPAMLRYLDNDSNRVGDPQENWAREWWELYSLGVDQYTQADIVAAARAWTGHGVNDWIDENRGLDQYVFRANWHDNGNKTIFGNTRNWNGPEVIDYTLDGPKRDVCARFLVRKLWNFFAYPGPPSTVVDALAAVLLNTNWDIKAVMRALLLRPEFYSTTAKTGLLRTPVDYIVAATRYSGTQIHPDNMPDDNNGTYIHPNWYEDTMGMELGQPPDVSGWKQNGYWISASTYWSRAEFASHITWVAGKRGLFSTFTNGSMTPTAMADAALAQFGVDAPTPSTRQALIDLLTLDNTSGRRWALPGNAIRMVMLSPDFQLA